jgi:hypothetical protein
MWWRRRRRRGNRLWLLRRLRLPGRRCRNGGRRDSPLRTRGRRRIGLRDCRCLSGRARSADENVRRREAKDGEYASRKPAKSG